MKVVVAKKIKLSDQLKTRSPIPRPHHHFYHQLYNLPGDSGLEELGETYGIGLETVRGRIKP